MIPLHSLRVGDLLRRPKGLFTQHVGLYAGNGYVFDNAPQRGQGLVSFSEFSQGHPVWAERTSLPPEVAVMRLRARLAKPQPYALFTNNCEHAAFEVLQGKPSSPQLAAALGGIALGLMITLLLSET
ncbi:MAG: hypothetical protein JSS11_05835 [Verrucomicrobia bacterium]|nr:hypothetical protein [Verrucomicrobiota bacterium]